jgi:hypothetical protein
MKKIFLIISLTTATAFAVKSQNKLTTDQQQVQKTITEMFRGIAESDQEQVRHNCTTDIKILENGVVWNIDSLVSKINERKSLSYTRINTLDFIETTINRNVAWAFYNNQADVTLNGQSGTIKWLESALLIKDGKEWKIKLLHSTLVERIKK